MAGRVSARLAEGNSGPVYYPRAEIVAALNEANRFFCLLTLGLETTAVWSVPSATTFFHMLSYFPDWIAPLRITTVSGAKVRPARLNELTALDSGWMGSPGSPTRYCAMGADFLALYPQPPVPTPPATGTTLNVTYARAPLTLANDSDEPETPAEYHPKYVDYGIYRMRQGEGSQEFAKALGYLDSFFEGAQHYAAYVRARNLGSRYDKTPFEIESFDRSGMRKPGQDRSTPAAAPEGE